MISIELSVETTLPDDGTSGTLVGRVWRPDVGGPSVVAIGADGVIDVSGKLPTMRDLCEAADPESKPRAAYCTSSGR